MTNKSEQEIIETTADKVKRSLKRRQAKEKRFRYLGLSAVFLGVLFVALLFISIVSKGHSAFWSTQIKLDIEFSEQILDADMADDPEALAYVDFRQLYRQALREQFPEVSGRTDKRKLYSLISSGANYYLRDKVLANPELMGTKQTLWLLADDEVDMVIKGQTDTSLAESERSIGDKQLAWIKQLQQQQQVRTVFNWAFFTQGDSREPEQAGIGGAIIGSAYTLLITILLAFPIGVATAVYLEEFAPTNKWTDLIEVNINNLAAVPSIVFGLLGLAIFINFFNMPRSAPLVGGMVLMLMTLPTIIIASRAALRAVPPSIRDAAMGIGASKVQVVTHHVLPLALPGMLTGTIIGLAQALGETAPLLMIGMVAFVVDIPGALTDPATVLPVQIFLWADSPERAFVERTSAAIMVLLGFLILMNLMAVILRRCFERRW